ncbi:MAG: DUF4062 domain-containing protein, partial [Pseudomonadota bacterium]
MEKRYQVFVSSTYQDLREERQEVIRALLELDCIPAGMELFPAADEDAWSLIKRVIDESDYYIVISAGRYGSTHPETGVGYTEMEYNYAVQSGKPALAFLHEDPGKLLAEKCETEPALRDQLEAFKAKAQERVVKTWTNKEDLAGVVSRSMIQLIRQKPGTGWVRADKQLPAETELQVRDLEDEVQRLEKLLHTEDVKTSYVNEVCAKLDLDPETILRAVGKATYHNALPVPEFHALIVRTTG